ncbi:unnamed protein product [Lactuca virosa]|uniref:Uncharacterized protein n=1 Tax=Lactuca virosa TaxID=75947 RepID=A0AAU9LHC5_9ASTR|nr:unnamed protein product [Lactuca virosa]
MKEWLDEYREEVVDNIQEEVVYDVQADVETSETKHRNENFNPHFFKKDNAPDCEMGENIGHRKPVDVDMVENEAEEVDSADDLPNIFNEEQHWKEQKPVALGVMDE